jgi:hypothetical protein
VFSKAFRVLTCGRDTGVESVDLIALKYYDGFVPIRRPGDETDMMLSPKGKRLSANDKENIGVNREWDTRVSEAEKVKLFVSERKEAFPEVRVQHLSHSLVSKRAYTHHLSSLLFHLLVSSTFLSPFSLLNVP